MEATLGQRGAAARGARRAAPRVADRPKASTARLEARGWWSWQLADLPSVGVGTLSS